MLWSGHPWPFVSGSFLEATFHQSEYSQVFGTSALLLTYCSAASDQPDPAHWGPPDANFESNDCSIDDYFFCHSVIFNTEFW